MENVGFMARTVYKSRREQWKAFFSERRAPNSSLTPHRSTLAIPVILEISLTAHLLDQHVATYGGTPRKIFN